MSQYIGNKPAVPLPSLALNDLTDVSTSGGANNDLLKLTSGVWLPFTPTFATAAQGSLADSAVQPGDNANTLGSGGAAAGTFLRADGAGATAFSNLPNVETLSNAGVASGQVLKADGDGTSSFAAPSSIGIVDTSSTQTVGGTKTFSSTITGSITGNAGTATTATTASATAQAVTFNNGGSGAASGTTFNGGTARTISYNTIGAAASTHSHTIAWTGGTTAGPTLSVQGGSAVAIPSATGSASGAVTTTTQSFAGEKTFSGKVILQGQIETTPGTNLGTTGTLTLNMDGASILSTGALTGAVTWATSNGAAGRSVTVRVVNGSTLRAFTFPAWKFVGPKPADIAESKIGILTITAFGTADTDIVAAWAVEE